MMKFVMILLFLIYLAFIERASTLELKHKIVKRKASAGQLYVYADRKGCVSVTSSSTCPLSWKMAPFFAKTYDLGAKVVETTLSLTHVLPGISSDCVNNLKNTLCSQITPKCSEDGSSDFGDAKAVCEKIYSSCPEVLVNEYKKQRLCEDKITTGLHSLEKCTGPTAYVTGVCSQPRHKMSPFLFEQYRQKSKTLEPTVKSMRSSKLYTSECMTKYEELICNPLYCSEDEQQLLIEFDQEDCMDVVKHCFKDLLDKLSGQNYQLTKQLDESLSAACKTYPKKSSAQRVAAPPIVAPYNAAENIKCQKPILFSLVIFSIITHFFM